MPFREAEPWRATEPCVEIRIGVEQTPTVTLIAFTSDDEERIRQWLAARPDLAQLVGWAAEYGLGRTVNEIISENLRRRDDELEAAA